MLSPLLRSRQALFSRRCLIRYTVRSYVTATPSLAARYRPLPRHPEHTEEDTTLEDQTLQYLHISRSRRDTGHDAQPGAEGGVIPSLLTRLQSWHKLRDTHIQLEKLGLASRTLQILLPRFVREGQTEIIEACPPSAKIEIPSSIQDLWATDSLEESLGHAESIDAKTALLDRSIFHRFLRWAPSQPSPDSPPVDNITTFSPYSNLEQVRQVLDLREPSALYPFTRRLRRKVIMHVGPTNSGKTYNALVALAQAESGAYAGPLRLLAHEIYDRLNKGLIKVSSAPGEPPRALARQCNLLTGEERRIVHPNAPLVSTTVEMLGVQQRYAVVVLDEIQMISDPHRGDAWTRAFLGVRAKELHLCGEETAVPLIRNLVKQTGDELIVNRYERLTPLSPGTKALQNLKNVQKGDCVVGFSRSGLFQLKHAIEKETGLKCAMVYGGLPPEIRAEQAALFNDPESGYEVMVASDAVGMGLNLKIKRVIFASLSKWNGVKEEPLSISQTKQIAGRAGRFGLHSEDSVGEATTLKGRDLKPLKQCMSAALPAITHAVLKPSQEMVERLATLLPPGTPFGSLMDLCQTSTLLCSPYTAGRDQSGFPAAMKVTQSVENKLPASDCMTLLHCPMNLRDPLLVASLTDMATTFADNAHVPLVTMFESSPMIRSFRMVQKLQAFSKQNGGWSEARRKKIASELAERQHVALSHLESLHKAITGYLWMGNRQPPSFSDFPKAMEMKADVESAIDFYLMLVITSGSRFDLVRKPKKGPGVMLDSVSSNLSDAMDLGDGVDLSSPPPKPVTRLSQL